jgi:hypothetical protein
MSDADLEEANSYRMLEPPSVEAMEASVSAVEPNQHDEMDVVFKVRIHTPPAYFPLPPSTGGRFHIHSQSAPLCPATCVRHAVLLREHDLELLQRLSIPGHFLRALAGCGLGLGGRRRASSRR